MTKKEDAPAEIEVAEAPAATTAAEEEEEAADIEIERGYLQKKGSNPLNPWNKRYFAFGTEPININNLQALHKRNERRVKAAPAAAAPAPAEGEAAAEATEVAAAAAPAAPAAPAKVSDVYEQANKDLLVNIAHATQTGKGLLFYHKSDDSSHVANPLGVINLRDVNSVERVEKSSKNRSFVVSTKNRDYHFSAGTSQEAKGWVKAIQEKSEEAKAAKDPYESPQFGEVYKQLVAREAFDHAKNSVTIVDDNLSDGEPDDIEVNSSGTPIVKKRKSFFGFSAVATSHEKKKADGVTTEVNTEQHQDLTHVQDGDVDALKTHESQNAVAHTTDGVAAPPAEAPKSPKAKSGGFSFFGKKPAKPEEPAPAPAAETPLTVDDAKAQALKAVDDAVEASKAKAAVVTAGPPATPPVEKKPGFFAGLFGKKPTPPPAPAPVANEETIVVSSENNFSDVVTAEGEATSQSSEGFFSRVTKGKDKNEVEVKSSEIATEDVTTAEGTSHTEHVAGTDANAVTEGDESRVDLSTTDETIATTDKVERKPSLLKRISGAVRATRAPAVEDAKETVIEETTTETVVEETKVAETTTTTETTVSA
ncbi:hypothetical protein BGZ92_011053 [Podila epicladia]|nr:hypothetical protein BGZ92_011053 [Podila epicladia]